MSLKQINKILGINDSYQAPQRLMDILTGDIKERDEVFKQFLELFHYDVTVDWFHQYFQDEHADRREKKQDFTPNSVSNLLTAIVGEGDGTYYEPGAGTGGIMIKQWNSNRCEYSPFEYEPRFHWYHVEDLSDRAFPFLLFNMLIRGMNGIAVHCDVLTRESYGAFFIQNDFNDHMKFSSLNLMPYNEATEKELNIKFVEERYQPVKQTKEIPEWLGLAMNTEIQKEKSDNQLTIFEVM